MIAQETDFRAEPVNGGSAISFADERLQTVPVLFADSPEEKDDWRYLIDYMLVGGFVVGNLSRGFSEAFARHTGLVPGDDVWIALMDQSHPVFNCYYDLQNGVFTEAAQPAAGGKSGRENREKLVFVGYYVQGRLAGLSSEPPLDFLPGLHAAKGKLTAQGKVVINTMVYVLGQEDGLAKRLLSLDRSAEGDPAAIDK